MLPLHALTSVVALYACICCRTLLPTVWDVAEQSIELQRIVNTTIMAIFGEGSDPFSNLTASEQEVRLALQAVTKTCH